MQGNEALDERQAEAGALVFAGVLVLDLREGLADAVELVGRNADAGVADGQHQVAAVACRVDRDHAAAIGEFYGIADEIDQHLLERPLVGDRLAEAARHTARQLNTLFARLKAEHLLAGVDAHGDVEGLGQQFIAPRLDLRDIQHRVDDGKQMAARLVDERHIFALPVVLQLAEIFAGEDVGKTEDGVQRRAQFMADGGEKPRLGVIGRFRLGGLARALAAKRRLVGYVARLGDDRRRRAIRTRAGCQVRAHVHELLGLGAGAPAFDAQVDGDVRSALAKAVHRGQEAKAIRDMDLVEEAAAERAAHPAEDRLAVAAVHRGHMTTHVVQRHEAGEEIIGRGLCSGRRRTVGRGGRRRRVRTPANRGSTGEQRAGNGKSRTDRKRRRGGKKGCECQRQAGDRDERAEADAAEADGCRVMRGRADVARHGSRGGRHPLSDVTQKTQRKTLPNLFFSMPSKSHWRLKERINARLRKGAKKGEKSRFEAIQQLFRQCG